VAKNRIRGWVLILAVSLIAPIAAAAVQQTPQASSLGPHPGPPGSGIKNVQVLTGTFDLLPTMHVIRASLGVKCDYCHITETGQYWRDDKPAKRRAREMLRMVQQINQANFGGKQVVTCNTCHRGSPHPVSVVPIGQGLAFDTTHSELVAAGPPAPTAKEVLDAYLAAVGGRDRLKSVKSREVHLTVMRSAQVEATPSQVANRGQAQKVETYQQASGRYAYVRALPLSTFLLIGDAAWIRSPQGPQRLTAEQAELVKSEERLGLDIGRELEWANRLSSAQPARREVIDGRVVWMVTGDGPGQAWTRERLYFDADTGLLVRRTVLRPTKAGPDPEQTDFADYRRVDGILLPFRTTTSYIDDNHLGVTRIVASVKENVPMDENTFQP
jgi:hypothetical protein